MALFKFTKTMLDGQPIDLYNEGRMVRDFTYIDDIVNGVVGVLDRIPEPDGTYDAASPDPSRSHAPYRVFNIGNNEPVQLMTFVEALEGALGVTAQKRLLPLQAGDVLSTHAEVSSLAAWTGVTPSTPIEEGVRRFVAWYRAYYSR
jgi:UDP-glucuronate 4-epimerase